MTTNITWSDGENMTFSDGVNAIWSFADFICAASVTVRDYNNLKSCFSIALRDYKATVCLHSETLRASFKEAVFDLYATEKTALVETYLGQTGGTLSDITLADGTWYIEARPYGNQWNAVRCGKLLTIVISSGVIDSITGLPAIDNLYSNANNVYGTDIFWTWNDGFGITDPETFGLWFDASASIDTSGTADATVFAQDALTLTGYRRAQTVQEYVAVIAIDSSGNKGIQSELLLPITVGTPTAPAYEWGENEL